MEPPEPLNTKVPKADRIKMNEIADKLNVLANGIATAETQKTGLLQAYAQTRMARDKLWEEWSNRFKLNKQKTYRYRSESGEITPETK